MKTLDITFDLETCSLSPTAAVMSIGAVAWDRTGYDSPFFMDNGAEDELSSFSAYVDVCGMFVDGFTFDKSTGQWWSRQSDEAKAAVVNCYQERKPMPTVLDDFFSWIEDRKEEQNADEVFLWSQGTDFDVAILKNAWIHYNPCKDIAKDFPIPHTNFCDHRTFFLQNAKRILDARGKEYSLRNAYALVDRWTEGYAHEPVFDCHKSIYSTWQMMKMISRLESPEIVG